MAEQQTNIPAIPSSTERDLDFLLQDYFFKNFTYFEIQEFLKTRHGIEKSLSTINRHLQRLGLIRRPLAHNRLSFNATLVAVQEELEGSGANLGYRRVWVALKRKGFIVRREDVRLSLLMLDPEGVELRRRHKLRRRRYRNPGPNKKWHLDGYDKLKPFGFSIHGCIDGYSRRILWLDVSSSNKRPDLIAKYYLDAVSQLKGVPEGLVADDGTEHATIEPIHIYLRDDENSFSVVPSPRNQRIEAYWSKLRNDRVGWWRSFFIDLVDLNAYDTSDPVQVDIARFCFMRLLRSELKEIAEDWNCHLISKNVNGGPSGRPDTMYFLPHLYDSRSYLVQVDVEDVNDFYPALQDLPRDYSNEIEEFSNIFMEENHIEQPQNAADALELFVFLKEQAANY